MPTAALADDGVEAIPDSAVESLGTVAGGCDGITADATGNVYCGALETGDVVRLNTSSGAQDVLAEADAGDGGWSNCLFVHGGHLWIVSNSLHVFTWSELSATGNNFRLSRLRLDPDASAGAYYGISSAASVVAMNADSTAVAIVLVVTATVFSVLFQI